MVPGIPQGPDIPAIPRLGHWPLLSPRWERAGGLLLLPCPRAWRFTCLHCYVEYPAGSRPWVTFLPGNSGSAALGGAFTQFKRHLYPIQEPPLPNSGAIFTQFRRRICKLQVAPADYSGAPFLYLGGTWTQGNALFKNFSSIEVWGYILLCMCHIFQKVTRSTFCNIYLLILGLCFQLNQCRQTLLFRQNAP